ncbi:MAG: hypothetical protein ACI93R_002172 [Flavobacteriales bacterium]|jgi:hypothetical protein
MNRIGIILIHAFLVFYSLSCTASNEAVQIIFKSKDGLFVSQKNNVPYINLGFTVWDPNWKYIGFKKRVTISGNHSSFNYQTTKKQSYELKVRGEIDKISNHELTLRSELHSNKSSEIHLAQFSIKFGDAFRGGSLRYFDGTWRDKKLPLGRAKLPGKITALELIDNSGGTLQITFKNAISLQADGELRLVFAEAGLSPATAYGLDATFKFSSTVEVVNAKEALTEDPDTWYPFRGELPFPSESVLSLEDWKPHIIESDQRIESIEDHLSYSGSDIKLWGLNYSYLSCAPEKRVADTKVQTLLDLGINSVRLHKYAQGHGWSGMGDKSTATQFDPKLLDRFDYFYAKLKESNIFVNLSPIFIASVGEQDVSRIPYIHEFAKLKKGRHRYVTSHGAIYFSKELQDIVIDQALNFMRHKNPYTGNQYAKDSGIAFYEMYNEDSVLFYGSSKILATSQTLRGRMGQQFSQWLIKKYDSSTAVEAAWGAGNISPGFLPKNLRDENLSLGIVYPYVNPWLLDPDNINHSHKRYRVRLLDSMTFLYELQNSFYGRYRDALREVGYNGELISSNWHAGRSYSHYLNLHSDAMIGPIDRHNYVGGLQKDKTTINNTSMLSSPGFGILSSGLHQVDNRPFILSEWLHGFPNEWKAEGPAIISAYGMGLQGWDASYAFNRNYDDGNYSQTIGKSPLDAMTVDFVGLFPAVSRQVLRGDIHSAPITHKRYVTTESLTSGELDFDDTSSATKDTKTYSTSVFPAEALAVARSVVSYQPGASSKAFDYSKYQDVGSLRSASGQLEWFAKKGPQQGHITIDSAGTQGAVGFISDKKFDLGAVKFSVSSNFSSIYFTALGQYESLDVNESGILLTAMAGVKNANMRINDHKFLLSEGDAGRIVLEAVELEFTLKNSAIKVLVLDQNGVPTGEEIKPESDGRYKINTAKYQSPYYLIKPLLQ